MFRITINGKSQPSENAGNRCADLVQHAIVERMRESGIRNPMVRVEEYVVSGAAAPRRIAAEDEE